MKDHISHTDMTQDAGALIKKINKIRSELTMKTEVKHISRENGQFEYLLQPEQYLINRCDQMSKEKRREMECSSEKVYLNDLNHTINRSVNEYIREMDARAAIETEIQKKFKEYAQYVDVDARYSFQYATRSMIKCTYGFNQHSTRDRIINGCTADVCICYGQIEN